jgi:hypothetical protein
LGQFAAQLLIEKGAGPLIEAAAGG